jgi:PEP-CTERM motif
MKFAIKSLAVAAALVAGGAHAVTIVPGVATTVVDPSGNTTRTAEFTLLTGYSGGNVNAASFITGGDLIFGAGAYVGGTAPSSITAVGGTLGALNVGNITMTGQSGVTITEQWRARNLDKNVYPTKAAAQAALSNPNIFNPGGTAPLATTATTSGITRVASKAGSTIASLDAITTGPNAGQILSANAVGGAFQQGTLIAGTLTGGSLLVENIRFDIANRAVIARVVGDASAYEDENGNEIDPAAVVDENMTLWTWGANDTVGPISLNPDAVLAADPVAALTAEGFTLLNQVSSGQLNTNTPDPTDTFQKYTVLAPTTFNNLQITAAGRQFFINSLGLGPTGITALDAVNTATGGWGKVASNIVFEVQEVPEPSTYALMGLGLVGISLVARRRSAAK